MRLAVYPGTFDPFTYGHLDLVQRGLKIFDRVHVAVARNNSKNTMFNHEERLMMVRELLEEDERVEVGGFSGLTVDYARELGAVAIIRGLRAVSDFDYETQMAMMNRRLGEIETVIMVASLKWSFVNATIVREIASMGGDVSFLVPETIERHMRDKLGA